MGGEQPICRCGRGRCAHTVNAPTAGIDKGRSTVDTDRFRWLQRIKQHYWGRALVLAVLVAAAMAAMTLLDPTIAQAKYLWFVGLVVLPSAARTDRQFSLAQIPLHVYSGTRVRPVLEEGGVDNWVLLVCSMFLSVWLCGLTLYGDVKARNGGFLRGWMCLPTGQDLPILLAPCLCPSTRKRHFRVFSAHGPVAFDPSSAYGFYVTGGPRELRCELVVQEVEGRTFLQPMPQDLWC